MGSEAITNEQSTDTETGQATVDESDAGAGEHPYIVRRAMQDKGIQFERDERLTVFVHDDDVDSEREVLSELSQRLGRDVPKLAFREAAYRAALRRPETILTEFGRMGYDMD